MLGSKGLGEVFPKMAKKKQLGLESTKTCVSKVCVFENTCGPLLEN